VVVPWFGANSWQAVLQPVPGGNIPVTSAKIDMKFVFNDGGAPDFHSNFERIKERLQQAVEAARGSGRMGAGGVPIGEAYTGVDMDSVHLDQLPTYEASGYDPMAPLSSHDYSHPAPMAVLSHNDPSSDGGSLSPSSSRTADIEPPNEAPPGYEETQQQSVHEALERRMMQQ